MVLEINLVGVVKHLSVCHLEPRHSLRGDNIVKTNANQKNNVHTALRLFTRDGKSSSWRKRYVELDVVHEYYAFCLFVYYL